MTTCSILAWARNLCRSSFRFSFSNVDSTHAVGGYTSDQVLGLLQAALPTDTAGTIVVLTSTNDRVSPALYTAAQTITNLLAIENYVLAQGRVMIWMNEMPRGGSNVLSGAQLQAHLSVIAWLRNRSTIPGVYVADTFGAMADLTQSDARPLTGMMRADSLHPQSLGAYTAAIELKKIFDILFPVPPSLASGSADLYDATNNPRGALNANPMMTGTGGTKTQTAGTLSGNLADSYTCILNATGATATLSKVTSSGKDWQQVALSGTSTAGHTMSIFATTSVASSMATNDVYEQAVEWELDASQTGIQDVVNTASLSGLTRRDLSGDATNFPVLGTAALSMVSKLGPFVAGSPETGFYKPGLVINFVPNTAISATVRMRALSARKIV